MVIFHSYQTDDQKLDVQIPVQIIQNPPSWRHFPSVPPLIRSSPAAARGDLIPAAGHGFQVIRAQRDATGGAHRQLLKSPTSSMEKNVWMTGKQ